MTRSAEARVDWRTLAILAVWAIGWVNCLEYWMKAWMSPSFSAFRAAMMPPTTQMTT